MTCTAVLTTALTILSGVAIYVVGQIVVRLVIEPVQETKRTISQISHTFIEYGSVIHNLDVSAKETISEVSNDLIKLSAQLHAHLFLVPFYRVTAFIFRLPPETKILRAAGQLVGLSNSIFSTKDDIYEEIARREEVICDSLGIYFPADERWPRE